MNVFIYDSFLNQKKYDRLLAQIETRITDLGLNGKISRLSLTRNVAETVDSELKRGAKTIVAVGNDKLVNQVVNSLAGSPVPLGIIPVGEDNNYIAKSLGIASTGAACDILSARLLIRLDLGMAGQNYFLGRAAIDNQGTVIGMNKDYTIETLEKGLIYVFNLPGTDMQLPEKVRLRPDDGVLELVISAQSGRFLKQRPDNSIFKIKKVSITNPRAQLILDGSVPVDTPVEITIAPKFLNVIVGKGRSF